MTPAPESTPTLWFCPSCTNRDWHLPTELSTTTVADLSPESMEVTGHDETMESQLDKRSPVKRSANLQPSSKRKFTSNIDRALYGAYASNSKPKPSHIVPPIPHTRPQKQQSIPRKKSKYSSFTTEVDEALATIHKELEVAASLGKREEALQDKIRALEQELKLKDGQVVLFEKELEFIKRSDTVLEGKRLKSENEKLREDNERLRAELAALERRDRERGDERVKRSGLSVRRYFDD